MKKNLFLLFSIYFFVLQPLVIGILRGEANFFRLGAVNLIAIILIGLLYNTVEGKSKPEEVPEHEKHPVAKEAKVSFHDHFRAVTKEHRKKSELASPFIISFIAAIIFFLMFSYASGSLRAMSVVALAVGFIMFVILTLMFKHRITRRFFALIGTKIYLILLLLSIALTAYDYYTVYNEFNASFQDYLGQNLLGQEKIPTDGYVFTGEGTVLGTGLGDITGTEETLSDVFSGNTVDSDVQEATGTVIGTSTEETPVATTETAATTIGKQKIMDAVIYLIKKYDIPLITKHDMSFTYVSFQNPYYNEWRTAYGKKLIGSTTNPSKYIVCESYIVMKGLLEGRKVPYTSSTVLANFRAEAVKRDALNGCKKGMIVTDQTL